jgi:hypothetical protein
LFDSGDDFAGIFGPDEWLGALVCLGKDAVDGGFAFFGGAETAALETLIGELGDAVLDRCESEGRGWPEVEDEAGIACEPFHRLGVLVSGVVIDDGADGLFLGDVGVDGVADADELLMPGSLHASSGDLAYENVEGGEQRRRAVALIVVGHGPGASFFR